MMVEKCGCAFADIHINKPYNYNGSFCLYDYCNKSLLESQYQCIRHFYDSLNFSAHCLDCKMPSCVNWEYPDRHAALDYFINFPADDFASDFLSNDHPAISDMISTYGNMSNVPNNFVSKNFAKVTVGFEDIHIRHKKAVRSMSGFSLFSDLGGAFGFWIGCSIITFVEFIEWLFRMIITLVYRKKEHVPSNSSSMVQITPTNSNNK